MELGDRCLEPFAAAALVSDLDAAVVFIGRSNHPFPFLWIVARRLLHIDMLARFATQDGRRAMPMIRGSAKECV
jgi:hypothetical protein